MAKYIHLASTQECHIDTDTLGLAGGKHILVVTAHADGFTESEYSNEVEVNGGGSTGGDNGQADGYTLSVNFGGYANICRLFINGEEVETSSNGTYYNVDTWEIWSTNAGFVVSCKNDDRVNEEFTYSFPEDIREDGYEASGTGTITLRADDSITIWQK